MVVKSKTGDKSKMVLEVKKRITSIVNERREAYDKKVKAGIAIGGTFQFHINRKGKTYNRVGWSYSINTEDGPRLMKGVHELQTF